MYISNQITLKEEWTTLNPNFDVLDWSIYPIDGDIILQLKDSDGWGDLIYGYRGIPMGVSYSLLNLRIKAVSGNVNVSYYLSGQ